MEKKKEITIGPKVAPKSSPMFQEFRIWHNLNNIQLIDNERNSKRSLYEEEIYYMKELSIRDKLSKAEALRVLGKKKNRQWDLNYKELEEGNRTQATLFSYYNKIIMMTGHEECFKQLKAPEIRHYIKTIFRKLRV